MISGFSGIAADNLGFLAMGAGLVLIAWSRLRPWFPAGLAVASAIMLASWLTLAELGALVLFLVPPYLMCEWRWGRANAGGTWQVGCLLAWQVGLFVVLRKYQWVSSASWLDHPLAVIGLSYMLFRVIHLVIEAPYLGHLRFGPGSYLTYVLAFWTLLSGPIQRYDDYCAGMDTIGRPSADEALGAGHRAVNGLIKAFLIAPLLLAASDIRVLDAARTDWLDLVVVFYSFPIYLYLNFSGYTDLVIGMTRLCGMRTMPENFNHPYAARNIQDFWKRWHMSFSTWIRYYVFTSLSKFLVRAGGGGLESVMLAIAVVATFLVVGAWHGTASNFLVFGLLHGIALIVGAMWGGMLKRMLGASRKRAFERHPMSRGGAIVLCQHYVCFTILIFNNSVADVVFRLSRLTV